MNLVSGVCFCDTIDGFVRGIFSLDAGSTRLLRASPTHQHGLVHVCSKHPYHRDE